MRHNNFRRSRKIRVALWGQAKDAANKRNSPCGQHAGRSSSRKISSFGKQLSQRRIVMAFYALQRENDLRIIATNALHSKGNTVDNLMALLETRLSTVLFRSGLFPTIFSAKQFISHKHVMINGKIINLAGYKLKEGDEVEIIQKMKMHQDVVRAVNSKHLSGLAVPDYLEIDLDKRTVKLLKVPKFEDISFTCKIHPQDLVEYYSERV